MGYLLGSFGGGSGSTKQETVILSADGSHQVNAGTMIQIISILGGGLSAIPPDNTPYVNSDFAVPPNAGRVIHVDQHGVIITNGIGHDVSIQMVKSTLQGAVVDPAYVVVMQRGQNFAVVDGGFSYTISGITNIPYPGQVRTPITQHIKIGTAPGLDDVAILQDYPGGVNIDITINRTFDQGAILYFSGITVLTAINIISTKNPNSNPF